MWVLPPAVNHDIKEQEMRGSVEVFSRRVQVSMGNEWIDLDTMVFFHSGALAEVGKECGESHFSLTSPFWISWKARGF